jgi:glycosyltransferase involved in cell wall biosynthesis
LFADIVKLLTIAIPTYNRHEIFSRNFPAVLSAISKWRGVVEIVVVDNGSEPPYVLPAHACEADVRLYRNPSNIGLGGNLLRCLEHAQGNFVWLLGDDDPVTATSVATIISVVAALHNRNVLAVGFSNNHISASPHRVSQILTRGLEGFLNIPMAMHWLSSISVAVYNRLGMMRELEVGYTYQDGYPHVAMVLSALRKDKELEVLFRPEEIVEDGGQRGWDYLEIALRQPSMFELPFSEQERAKLGTAYRAYPYRPPDVIRAIYRRFDKNAGSLATSRYQLDQLIRRSRRLKTFTLRGFIALVAFRFALRWPALLRSALNCAYRIAKKRPL